MMRYASLGLGVAALIAVGLSVAGLGPAADAAAVGLVGIGLIWMLLGIVMSADRTRL